MANPKAPASAKARATQPASTKRDPNNTKGAANRPQAHRPSRAVRAEVTQAARDLARLVVLTARDSEVAGVLEGDLPQIMAAVIDSASSRDPTAVASRALLFRLMRHPAASAAEAGKDATNRPGELRSRLVGRLTGGQPKVIEGQSAPAGRAGVTAEDAKAPIGLPF